MVKWSPKDIKKILDKDKKDWTWTYVKL
jgi:hypothetical protein